MNLSIIENLSVQDQLNLIKQQEKRKGLFNWWGWCFEQQQQQQQKSFQFHSRTNSIQRLIHWYIVSSFFIWWKWIFIGFQFIYIKREKNQWKKKKQIEWNESNNWKWMMWIIISLSSCLCVCFCVWLMCVFRWTKKKKNISFWNDHHIGI